LEVSDIFCTFAASKRTSLDNVIINRAMRHSLAHWRGLGIDRTWNMTVERITPAALIRQSGGNWLLMLCIAPFYQPCNFHRKHNISIYYVR
jgi:hypothetical protein